MISRAQAKFAVVLEAIFAIAAWMDDLDFWVRFASGVAAVIVAIFAIIHYIQKIRMYAIERKIKLKELELKDQQHFDYLIEKKKQEKNDS